MLFRSGIPASYGYNCIHKMNVLQCESFAKSTGRKWASGNSSLCRTEHACEEEGIWIPGSYLLGEQDDMTDVAEAMDKIRMAADELMDKED